MKKGSYMSQEDIQEYLLAGTRTNKKRRIRYEQGKQNIIKTKKELEEFIRNAVSKRGIEEFAVYGKVWPELGEKVILASHGTVNIFGKYLELSSTDLWHAFYNHQTAKEIGNMDLTFDELVYALDNINDAEVEKVVKRENGKLTLELSLETDGGKIILIEVVSKSAGSICLKTCWKVNSEKYEQIYKK